MNKSCHQCKHFHQHREEESWEMPHIFWYVYICDARPSIVNLKQFPFKSTKCDKFSAEVKTEGQHENAFI